MKQVLLLALLANCAFSEGAWAVGYEIVGAGTISCGAWTHNRQFARDQPVTLGEEEWVQGFITAYNAFVWKGNNVASETDADGTWAWIDGYCAGHPTNNLSDATAQLVFFLTRGSHVNDKPR